MSAIDIMTPVGGDGTTVSQPHPVTVSPSPDMDARVMSGSSKGQQQTQLPEELQRGNDTELLAKMVEALKQKYQARNTSLSFTIDTETDTLVVKVIDVKSDKVIRQIPPEELLALRKRIESLVGTLLDKEA